MPSNQVARFIDHTLLKADANEAMVKKLCNEAIEFRFYSVCVNPIYVPLCQEQTKESDVLVCTVIDFPLGAGSIEQKKLMTKWCCQNGADEVDMVIPIGFLKDQKYNLVLDHINAVCDSTTRNQPVKVIIETSLLTLDEKIKMCELISQSKAQFIKTSTGFSTGGAQLSDIELFKKHLHPDKKIKASGGIKNYLEAKSFIEAGCSRLGTSRGVEIVQGAL